MQREKMTVDKLIKALCLKEKEVVSDGKLKMVGWDKVFRIDTTFSGYISISNTKDSFFFYLEHCDINKSREPIYKIVNTRADLFEASLKELEKRLKLKIFDR